MALVRIDSNKKKSGYGRNIGGGILQATNLATQGVNAAVNPVGYLENLLKKNISNLTGLERTPSQAQLPELAIPEYFQPQGITDQFTQDVVSALALNPQSLAVNSLSGLGKSVGNTALNLGLSQLGGAAGQGAADVTGISKIPYIGKILKQLAGVGGSLAGPGTARSLYNVARPINQKVQQLEETAFEPEKYRKQLTAQKDILKKSLDIDKFKQDINAEKKALYQQARNNPEAYTNQKELRKELGKSLKLEHEYSFNKSESNRKNLEAGLNRFRKDKMNIAQSIHQPQKYSNFELLKHIEKPKDKIDLDRLKFISELFPNKNFINKDGDINYKKLETLYKDNIKLNELFDIKKHFNAINYGNRGKISPGMSKAERAIQEGITKAAERHPEQVKNFRAADEIHILEKLKKDPNNERLLEYASRKFPQEVAAVRKGQSIESVLNTKDKNASLTEYAQQNNPETIQARNQLDSLKKVIENPKTENLNNIQYALHKLFKLSKYFGIGKILETANIGYQSFKQLPDETKSFFYDNLIDGMKENPAIFQKDLREINKKLDIKPKVKLKRIK